MTTGIRNYTNGTTVKPWTAKRLLHALYALEGALGAVEVFGWAKNHYWTEDANGHITGVDLLGSVLLTNAPVKVEDDVLVLLHRALGKAHGSSLVSYNDAPGRTKKDIVKLLRKALHEGYADYEILSNCAE